MSGTDRFWTAWRRSSTTAITARGWRFWTPNSWGSHIADRVSTSWLSKTPICGINSSGPNPFPFTSPCWGKSSIKTSEGTRSWRSPTMRRSTARKRSGPCPTFWMWIRLLDFNQPSNRALPVWHTHAWRSHPRVLPSSFAPPPQHDGGGSFARFARRPYQSLAGSPCAARCGCSFRGWHVNQCAVQGPDSSVHRRGRLERKGSEWQRFLETMTCIDDTWAWQCQAVHGWTWQPGLTMLYDAHGLTMPARVEKKTAVVVALDRACLIWFHFFADNSSCYCFSRPGILISVSRGEMITQRSDTILRYSVSWWKFN